MNFLNFFIIVNDLSVVFGDLDLSGLSVYESNMLLLFTNICIWFFIFIIFNILFKIFVRLK